MSYEAFANGKIEMVASAVGIRLNPAAYDTVIDIAGKHVYPALISPNTILGLQSKRRPLGQQAITMKWAELTLM